MRSPRLRLSEDHIKGTSITLWACTPALAAPGTAMTRDGGRPHFPYRRVKGGSWEIGLGRLVNCRHHPSAARRLSPQTGLHTPVPGVSSKAVRPPENTVHISDIRSQGQPAPVLANHRILGQIRPAEATLSSFLAGCKTCRHKQTACGAWCFIRHGTNTAAQAAERTVSR